MIVNTYLEGRVCPFADERKQAIPDSKLGRKGREAMDLKQRTRTASAGGIPAQRFTLARWSPGERALAIGAVENAGPPGQTGPLPDFREHIPPDRGKGSG